MLRNITAEFYCDHCNKKMLVGVKSPGYLSIQEVAESNLQKLGGSVGSDGRHYCKQCTDIINTPPAEDGWREFVTDGVVEWVAYYKKVNGRWLKVMKTSYGYYLGMVTYTGGGRLTQSFDVSVIEEAKERAVEWVKNLKS